MGKEQAPAVPVPHPPQSDWSTTWPCDTQLYSVTKTPAPHVTEQEGGAVAASHCGTGVGAGDGTGVGAAASAILKKWPYRETHRVQAQYAMMLEKKRTLIGNHAA